MHNFTLPIILCVLLGCTSETKPEDTATTTSETSSQSNTTTGTTQTTGTTTGTTKTTGTTTGTTGTTDTGTETTETTDTGAAPTDPAVTAFEANLTDLLTLAGAPGAQAALIKDGQMVWSWNFGMANVEDGVPVTSDTSFPLASVSKTVTGTALMQVYETDAFELDDPIGPHLGFEVAHPTSAAPITFRHLLTHTSGIRDNWGIMPYSEGDPTVALRDYLEDYLDPDGDLYDASRNYNSWGPGDGFSYSNIGVALAGHLVEAITGIDFNDWCRDRIFEPLSMEHTGWYLRDLDDALVAHPHDCYYGPCRTLRHYGYADYPDGMLRASAEDMARFLAMTEQGGSLDGHVILNEETVAQMLTLQVPSQGQALIWYEANQGGEIFWGHNGGDIGVSTNMFVRKEDGVGYMFWLNGELSNWGPISEATAAMVEAADTLF